MKIDVMNGNLQSKVMGTVIAFFGWLAFIVLFLAFYPAHLSFWQRLAVFVASGSILICIIAVLWIKWTMRG